MRTRWALVALAAVAGLWWICSGSGTAARCDRIEAKGWEANTAEVLWWGENC